MRVSLPKWVWGYGAAFVLAGSLPFVIGWLSSPKDSFYTGIFINISDTNAYLAIMQIGAHGRWWFVLPYTAQRSAPMPIYEFYILLGHIARLTPFTVPLVFHAARVVVGGAFVGASYHFFRRRLPQPHDVRLALGLLLFSAGWGWLTAILMQFDSSINRSNLAVDFYITDAISFLSLLANPHFLLEVCLIIVMISAGGAYIARGGARLGAAALITGVGIALVHAHQIAICGAVLAGGLLWQARDRRRIAWIEVGRLAIISGPGGLLAGGLTLLSRNDPYLLSWLKQGSTYSPPVYTLLILYGPLFPLALVGAWHAVQSKDVLLRDAVLWFGVVLLLLYVPVNFQLRFIEGWQVVVVLLAVVGWRQRVSPWLLRRMKARRVRRLQTVMVASLLITPLLIFTGALARGLWPAENTLLSPDEQDALHWLDTHASLDDVVLASEINGSTISAYAGVRSVAGHWSGTAYIHQRQEDIRRFFDGATPDRERMDLLRRLSVDYVYIAAEEREGGTFVPESAPYLVEVFASPTVTLYAVRLAAER